MRVVRLAAAFVALALAVGAFTLACDVKRTADAVEAADARFAVAPSARERWTTDTLLPGDLVRGALGTGDVERVRRALAAFTAAYRRRAAIGPGEDVQAARAAADAALTRIAVDSDRRVAGQAQDLLGLLAADDVSATAPGAPSPVERALAAFQAAVRLDHSNEAAKTNLEVALRLLEARGARAGAGGGVGPRSGGSRGAGAGQEGEGY